MTIETSWTSEDRAALALAASNLEGRSLAMTIAARVGMPIESLLRMLPANAQHSIGVAANRALEQCLHTALQYHTDAGGTVASKRSHTMITAATGALGGFFGLPGLVVELPLTTTVMLHSIAEIAHREGEDLADPQTALACLQVLALGPEGMPGSAGAIESAYYATRAALAQVTREAASYVAQKGAIKEGAPVLLSFLGKIAARFGVEVSEKAAAQLIPVAGAAGGLTLNILFTRHFQRLAEGHFIVRRLERKYGSEDVRREYEFTRASAVSPN